MVSQTVGCERPAGQPGELGLGVVGGQRSVSYGGVLRSGCLGWDVDGKWPPNPRSSAQGLVHHWHLIDVFNSVD